MFTRAQYMTGKITFEQYYSAVADSAGITLSNSPELIERCRAALAAGDVHLNTIRLHEWDAMARCSPSLAFALKKHGDFYSLAGGVCTLKQAAKNAVAA
ncbi:hypothetical protein UFOVP501_2 [uncultured Caudovirales phage]|uniref:Uncharacterized protein n=1 Tax=uncultured Caudovirales phage TaxID=2100421 RepID=A0A6J5MKU5_9CAUD|nr:hypothetical protein UFOVP501_2 [uncultured Caudovirales phage]CAB4161399.1 hypothetical protein UFOVP762_49 [uncultured Caudovirales phage]CAB4187133.1 hypothetical protein UFOVP1161_2 [uncultured Caudovirales phage]